MAIELNSLDIVRQYVSGVLGRSKHHAPNVSSVALALVGNVLWRSTGPIEVREYSGETANVLWFNIRNRRFAFVYNHETEEIELRNRTMKGQTIVCFNNSMSTTEIRKIFERL